MRKLITADEKGFTLVEMLFVVLLFPIVFLGIFSMLNIATDTFYTGDIYHRLNQSSMQTLRYIGREISQTSPLTSPSHLNISTDANGDSTVRFQIPVDWDNDSDVVTSDLSPDYEWGAYDQAGAKTSGRLNGWIQYIVVNDATYGKQLHRRILDASYTQISGLDQVVSSNVNTFVVSQSTNSVTMTLSLIGTDSVGERTLNSTFTSRTMLRNAVD